MKIARAILILIIILALFLRFLYLGSDPPSLSWDEVSHGYNAYSILTTGHDEWGQYFPISNFRAYGDYPLPLYMYLSMPAIAIFGLNEWTIRSTSALFGVFTIVLVYFFTGFLTKNKRIGLITAFLATIMPWNFMLDRQVLQSGPAIFFLALGMFLIFKYKEKRWWLFNLGVFSLGISAYGYHNTRIIAPLLWCLILMFNFKDFYKIRKYLFSFLILGVIFFAPLPFILLSPEGTARSSWVGIVDQGAINRINEARGNSNLSPFLSKLINNKVVYTVKVASLNYLNYFNPVYLGVTGGGQHQYSVPGFGLIFPEVLVFFYIGLGYLIIRIRNINNLLRLVIIWMVISPIPAAITRDPFQVVRSTTMLPVIFLVMGIGLWKSSEWLNKWSPKIMKPSIVLLIFIVLVSFGNYLYNYLYIYPKNDSFAWQYGYKQAMHYVEDSYDLYPKIYITRYYGEPHEFMLFYLKYDSNKLQKDPNLVRYYKNNWYWVDSFDKFVILDDEKIMDQTKDIHNALLITTPGNYLKQGQKIDQINFLDGSPAFDIIRL